MRLGGSKAWSARFCALRGAVLAGPESLENGERGALVWGRDQSRRTAAGGAKRRRNSRQASICGVGGSEVMRQHGGSVRRSVALSEGLIAA